MVVLLRVASVQVPSPSPQRAPVAVASVSSISRRAATAAQVTGACVVAPTCLVGVRATVHAYGRMPSVRIRGT